MYKLKLWNLKSKLYDYFRDIFPFSYILNAENKALLELLKDTSFSTVIDLGTGEGNALTLLPPTVRKIGVDFSYSMLKNAQRKVNTDFINANIESLPLKAHITDLVLIIGVAEYFSQLDFILKEINRITKDDAAIVLSYSPPNTGTFLRKVLGHKIYPLTKDQVSLIAEKNNFCIKKNCQTWLQHQVLLIKKK
jgi:ubiquinone/menaquinone biosynthesis C-methylase UbiE